MIEEPVRIAVIGGTGLYQIEGLTDIVEKEVNTPFGKPSEKIIIGTLNSKRIAFLSRHGVGHVISPTEVNSRANIYALKSLGVEQIISVSAVGSLKEEIEPLDIVIPDQLFDRTRHRQQSSFFGRGLVCHISFADPFCPILSNCLIETCNKLNFKVHKGGTYVCIEGPAFSTKAESNLYRAWGMDIIGMTALPEAKLAREAEICYSIIALVTDYDVWHSSAESVNVEMIIENLKRGVEKAKTIIKNVLPLIPKERTCACKDALANAIVTDQTKISAEVKNELRLLISKYIR